MADAQRALAVVELLTGSCSDFLNLDVHAFTLVTGEYKYCRNPFQGYSNILAAEASELPG